MFKRPLVWFSLMYVCGIYLFDKCYNRDYEDVISFFILIMIFLGIVFYISCVFKRNPIINNINKENIVEDNLNKRIDINYKFIVGCIIFLALGILQTYNTTKRTDDYIQVNEKYTSIIGTVDAIEEKENTYGLSLYMNSSKVLVYIDKNSFCPKVGDYVRISGDVNNFLKPTNPGQFDELSYYVKQLRYSYKVYAKECKIIDEQLTRLPLHKKIYYNTKRVLYRIKNVLKTNIYKVYNNKMAGLISGIILGEKSLINEETKTLYQNAGMSHILAISGLHVTIIGMCFYKILSKLKINVYVKNFLTILLVISYGIMINFTISTNRAVVMMVLMLTSRFFGRSYDIYTSVSLSLLIILVQNPLHIYNSGLLFSFFAIVGIIYILPAMEYCMTNSTQLVKNRDGVKINKITGQFEDENIIFDFRDIFRKLFEYMKKSLLSGISIYIATLPVMINTYYSITVLSVFTNIIVLALAELLIITCVATSIVSFISVKLSYFFAGVPFTVLTLYEKIGELVERFSINNIIIGHRYFWQVLLYYIVVAIFLIIIYGFKSREYIEDSKKKIILVIFLLCGIIFFKFDSKKLNITMLDVSQGDGLCIQTPNNKVITVDGGSSDIKDIDKYRLVPFLKYNGINVIDYAIISHTDSDHVSGIKGVLENSQCNIKIRNVVLPYVNEKTDAYSELENLLISNKVNILYFSKENKMNIDGVKFTCLHPSKDYTAYSENGYSQVLLMSYGKFDMMFTGDLEEDGEKLVMEEMKNLYEYKPKIEVLKVPHHGSKNSSTEEFISYINPKYALISAGKDNRYGHPHEETLERYANIGTKVYTTIHNGAIRIETDGEEIKFK